MVTENKSLAAIFPFELEKTINSPLFSETALEEKPITAMYTNAKVNGGQVDCTASARIITADRATKTPIRKINDFPIEVNDIIVPIKVLVIEATQYQALVGNNWLSKINAMLNWNTQELQLSQNGQTHTNNQSEIPPILDWKKRNKGKGKEREEDAQEKTTPAKEITSG
ncbi:hypothetical protein G9A89_021194 [Geosiphon pyriformis]|nr:hypothetical protein G9A89_021194 [Geosiphon pyriformis]